MLVKTRYEVGLSKLENAASEVGVMQEALEKLQPELAAAAARVEKTVQAVEKQKKEASEVEKIIMEDEVVANMQVIIIILVFFSLCYHLEKFRLG